MFCKEQAAQLCGIKQDIEAAGAKLAFIGSGEAVYAREFKTEFAPDCTVLTDPTTATYALLGTKRTIWPSWAPRSLPANLRAMRRGFRPSRTRGDARRLGGVAILDSRGAIKWKYLSRIAGDHPTPANLLAAVRALKQSNHP